MSQKTTLRLVRYRKILTIFYFLAIITAGLWPFEILNYLLGTTIKLHWLTDENGIETRPYTYLSTEGPTTQLSQSFKDSEEFSLEVYFMTLSKDQSGPARIVSYSLDPKKRNFTLGQDQGALIFRLRTTNTNDNGSIPSFRAENIIQSGEKQHIQFTYDGKTENLYLDGKLIKSFSGVSGNFANWASEHSVILGNELTGNRPWAGRLYLVALYNRVLNEKEITDNFNNVISNDHINSTGGREKRGLVGLYLFSEGKGDVVYDQSHANKAGNLYKTRLPKTEFSIGAFKKPGTGKLDYWDIIINILGFLPMSFIVYLNFSNKNHALNIYILSMIIGVVLSFSIEYLQQYSTSRCPTTTDIVLNFTGVLAGSVLLHFYRITRANNRSTFT